MAGEVWDFVAMCGFWKIILAMCGFWRVILGYVVMVL